MIVEPGGKLNVKSFGAPPSAEFVPTVPVMDTGLVSPAPGTMGAKVPGTFVPRGEIEFGVVIPPAPVVIGGTVTGGTDAAGSIVVAEAGAPPIIGRWKVCPTVGGELITGGLLALPGPTGADGAIGGTVTGAVDVLGAVVRET